MNLTGTKTVVLVLLGLLKLFIGLAPLLLTRILKRKEQFLKKFIGIVLCFGGGVLISTIFIHMLGEVRESITRAISMGMIPEEMEFPFSELLLCMGFLFILLTESIVHKMFGGSGHGHSHYPSMEKLDGIIVQETTVKIPRVGLDNPAYSPSASYNHPTSHRSPLSQKGSYSVSSVSLSSGTDSSTASSSVSVSPSKSSKKKKDSSLLASLRSFLVVLALSIHSLFEGMAIGLEESQSGVWKLFMAVAIHSTAIVFCVGTEMTTTGIRKGSVVLYMCVLSVVTPVGVLIGIVVTAHMDQASGGHILVIGALQGLAAGTLLYITFYEVLARDKLAKYGMSGLLGALAVLVGFLLMAGMEAGAGGHSHGDGGHDGHNHEGHQGHHHGYHEGQHHGEHEGHHHEDHDGHHHESHGDLDRAVALLKHQHEWERHLHQGDIENHENDHEHQEEHDLEHFDSSHPHHHDHEHDHHNSDYKHGDHNEFEEHQYQEKDDEHNHKYYHDDYDPNDNHNHNHENHDHDNEAHSDNDLHDHISPGNTSISNHYSDNDNYDHMTLDDQEFFPLNSTDSKFLHDEVSFDPESSIVTR